MFHSAGPISEYSPYVKHINTKKQKPLECHRQAQIEKQDHECILQESFNNLPVEIIKKITT